MIRDMAPHICRNTRCQESAVMNKKKHNSQKKTPEQIAEEQKRKSDYENYCRIIREHAEEIAGKIDQKVRESIPDLLIAVADDIAEEVNEDGMISVNTLDYSQCSFDHSGELGDPEIYRIDEISLEDYLNSPSGEWEPTFVSGCGKYWLQADEQYCDFSDEFGSIYDEAVKAYLTGCEDLDNSDVFHFAACDCFDDIYDHMEESWITFGGSDVLLEKGGIDRDISVYDFIKKYADSDKAKVLIENVNRQIEKDNQKKQEFLRKVPDNYADLYPDARKMKRHFILHIGPTNSGKTHDAIKAMEQCTSGVYLAPLRLLAAEQRGRIETDGFPCSLYTGEEECIVPVARFISETVEMADLHTEVDCAVIDECQMVADRDRGGAWTSAILGIPAHEIHLCASADAENILIKLIALCKDDFEIIRTVRMNPLIMEDKKFKYPDDVQKGDALIVFSRTHVHAVASELKKKGMKASVVYGMLPPDVRNKQAEDFRTGTTDVLVATDAIGMGMNLPIRRIVFLEIEKFDGMERRRLNAKETQQIAGRAGRYGVNESGCVNAYGRYSYIKSGLTAKISPIEKARIDFPFVLAGDSVTSGIDLWCDAEEHEGFERTDCSDFRKKAEAIEALTEDVHTVYSLSSIPFDLNDSYLVRIWLCLSRQIVNNEPMNIRLFIPKADTTDLKGLESQYRVADLLYAFADRYGYEDEKDEIVSLKNRLSEKMICLLDKQHFEPKKCRYCGAVMPWNYPYGMCQKCHDRMYRRYDDADDLW